MVSRNPDLGLHRSKFSETTAGEADEFARAVLPGIRPMLDVAANRLAFARKLNAVGTPTAHGGEWTDASVGNVLKRQV
jgi:hypothetical protein